MSQTGLPARQGLYDPANEHDACGVGFVAHIKGTRSHAIIRQGLQILHRLTHRGAVGADPRAGDGAGILIQIPDAFLRGSGGHRAAGRRRLRGRAWCSCRGPTRREAPGRGDRRDHRGGRAARAGLARRPGRQPRARRVGEAERALRPPDLRRPRSRLRRPGRVRAQAVRHPQARREPCPLLGPRVPGLLLHPVAVLAHPRLQGDAARRPGRRVLPRPPRRAHGVGARAGAPALLHQHLPDLGPGAPVPDDRAQRRDQHPARQPQLDGGAPPLHGVGNPGRRISTRSGR